MKALRILLIILFSLHLSLYASESDTVQSEKIYPLFESEEPLKLTLIIDLKTVKNDNSVDPQYSDGKLILHQDSITDLNFDIRVKARGHSRRLFDFCSFPPLMLNFKKKDMEGTAFEGQDKLKLVAYCKDVDLFQDYVLQEYLIYKVYNCLTPYSFKVRLAEITYRDLEDKTNEVVRYGFLIEDDDKMAERNGGKISEILISNHDRCDRNALDIFTIFEYMIGNTDWWIATPSTHNVKLMTINDQLPIPVPYDFDYCGAINAKYATPAEELEIESVRERYFRGYCRIAGTYEKTVAIFIDKKEAIYDVYNNFPLIDDNIKKVILKYYDDFYEIISDPKLSERHLYKNCELSHKHLYNLK